MRKNFKEYEKYEVEMTQSSVNDLEEIIDSISKNSPKKAIQVLKKLYDKINVLENFPYCERCVPELFARKIKDYRYITADTCRIIFYINENMVIVLAIVDSRRNLQDILINKLK